MSQRSLHQRMVDEFMRKGGQEVPSVPCIPSEEIRALRGKFFVEEPFEGIDALGFTPSVIIDGCVYPLRAGDGQGLDVVLLPHDRGCNIEKVADACADTNVISTGTLTAFGISDEDIQMAVDESNLKKVGPGSSRRADGKILKPPGWQPPELLPILNRQGYLPENQATVAST